MEAETKSSRLTLGEFLQHVRERNGLSVEYVADQLKLKVSTVRDLEANCYDHMGGLVYVKGYLRSYARLLHVDIESQLQADPQNKQAALDAAKEKRLQSQLRIKQATADYWLITLIIILAIALVGVFYDHYYVRAHGQKAVGLAPGPVLPAAIPAKTPVRVVQTTINAPSVSMPINVAPKPVQQPEPLLADDAQPLDASSDHRE